MTGQVMFESRIAFRGLRVSAQPDLCDFVVDIFEAIKFEPGLKREALQPGIFASVEKLEIFFPVATASEHLQPFAARVVKEGIVGKASEKQFDLLGFQLAGAAPEGVVLEIGFGRVVIELLQQSIELADLIALQRCRSVMKQLALLLDARLRLWTGQHGTCD